MQDGRVKFLLALAFLLGVVAAGAALGVTGWEGAAATLAAGAGLFGLGLGIGGLYVGLSAARRTPAEHTVPVQQRNGVTPPAIGDALPTVTDYYRNAPDGEPLRRAYCGRRTPDRHWIPDAERNGEDADHEADA